MRVWNTVNYVLSILFVLACCALFVAAATSCSSVRDAQRLEAMSDAEADAYAARVALQVGAIAEAAVSSGDLDSAALERIAQGIDGLVVGTTAPAAGGLAAALEVDGYGAAALTLAVIELDAELSRRGAIGGDGTLSPRARLVLAAVAAKLSQVATQE